MTHVEISVYGPWLGELIRRGVPVDGRYYRARGHNSWAPSAQLTFAHVQNETVHPRWVYDLTGASSKNSQWYWKLFRAQVLERNVLAPARKAKAAEAEAERQKARIERDQAYLIAKYGPDCLTPA